MKFTCNRDAFNEAVSNVQRAVAFKSTNPALEGIYIKAQDNILTLCGYDLDMGITTTIEANIAENGEIVVKAKLLADMLKNFQDNELVKFEVDEKKIVYIDCGKASFQIIGIAGEEFSEMPNFDHKEEISIDADILKDMVRKTRFALSTDLSTQRSVYTGALFDLCEGCFEIVALDGFKMAIRRENIVYNGHSRFVVPRKALNEILRLNTEENEKITMVIGNRHIIFNINKYSVFSKLLEGSFVDYRKTIPTGYLTSVVVNTDDLNRGVERISLLNQERLISPLVCKFYTDEIQLSSVTNVGKATDYLNAEINGEDVTIGFNHRYLLDTLNNIEEDKIRLEINGSARPMKIFATDSNSYMYVVLPMRIANYKEDKE